MKSQLERKVQESEAARENQEKEITHLKKKELERQAFIKIH